MMMMVSLWRHLTASLDSDQLLETHTGHHRCEWFTGRCCPLVTLCRTAGNQYNVWPGAWPHSTPWNQNILDWSQSCWCLTEAILVSPHITFIFITVSSVLNTDSEVTVSYMTFYFANIMLEEMISLTLILINFNVTLSNIRFYYCALSMFNKPVNQHENSCFHLYVLYAL